MAPGIELENRYEFPPLMTQFCFYMNVTKMSLEEAAKMWRWEEVTLLDREGVLREVVTREVA